MGHCSGAASAFPTSFKNSFVVVVLAVLALFPLPALTVTDPREKAALLTFKNSLIDDGYMLTGWDEFTDPCIDQWRGILCTCLTDFEDKVGRRIPVCSPIDPGYVTNYSRVLQLNLGDVRITDWNFLQGNLPPALGDLTALRILNLRNNNFTGSIPLEWAAMKNLEQLVLAGNNITGPLPTFLSTFDRLKYVFLENNQLTGPVPEEWCSGAWWPFEVSYNPRICDELPECLYDRIVSFEGTSLIDTVGDRDGGQGGYCDVAQPTCRREEDACWVQTPDPPYWTDATRISFSFPEFPSIEGGTPTTYVWRLGTTPGGGEVTSWAPFSGRNVTQTAELQRSPGEQKKAFTQTVFIANGTLPNGIALQQGGKYFVTVRGTNAGGPLQALQVVSEEMMVDATPPLLPPGSAVYSTEYYQSSTFHYDSRGIGVSWDPFEDLESGIVEYAYQVYEYVPRSDTDGGDAPPTYAGETQNSKIKTKELENRSVYITKLELIVGQYYFVRVYATNGAGIEAYRDGPPVLVKVPGEGDVINQNIDGLTVSKVLIIVAALVGATSAAVAVVTFYFAREKYRRRQQESRKYRGQMRNLRQLLNSLVERVGSNDKAHALDELRKLKNVAFVITDLEGSTKIADAAPRAYEWVQEAHDALLRDLIAVHGGYEINTEGDAFHVAFKDVATAVHFCMEVQYQMMDIEWPKEVLKLPECKEVRTSDDAGAWAYRGPRVRMGIHWAEEGSVVQHIHALTKHRVFTGPAFQVTRELCEAGRGGQVLMTHAVWERLKGHMPEAAFPVVEQLGCYKFASIPDQLWVYQATRLLGKPLHRPSLLEAGLMGAEQVEAGAGLSIVGAPVPRSSKGDLVFVSCRLALECCPGASSGDPAIPTPLHFRLFTVLASSAMQYSGFIFRMSESQGCYLVAFTSTVDALRFCHTAQVLLMYSPWPQAECGDYCGSEETAPDGKVTFKGPRVAMSIHESNDYSTRPVPRPCASPEGTSTHFADYVGPAEEIARVLSEVCQGGQVILSEPAWKAVQDQLPGQPQIISLGTHALTDPALPGTAMLMEVMPQVLAKRHFPPPRNSQMVEPGYRDAPSADGDVAIAQMRMVKPESVITAEAAGAGLTDEAIIRIITAYNVALARAVRAARQLLRTHGGYECKEPDPGKLTVAFKSLDSAVRWAAALQCSLLEVHWPQEVLTWEDCREIREGEEEERMSDGDPLDVGELAFTSAHLLHASSESPKGILHHHHDHHGGGAVTVASTASAAAAGGLSAGGAVVWRGLKVRIGIACGVPTSKAPLNTGRADYFGTIPNLAARLMSLAQAGQVLVDGAKLTSLRTLNWRDDVGVLPGSDTFPEGVELCSLGQFAIKGLDELRTVYESLPVSLSSRTFADSPAMVRTIGPLASMSRRISSIARTSTKVLDPGVVEKITEGTTVMTHASNTTNMNNSRRPGIFSSISRTGSVTGTGASARRGLGGASALLSPSIVSRSTSRISADSFDGTSGTVPMSIAAAIGRSSTLSTSGTSSGGSGAGKNGNWMMRPLLSLRSRGKSNGHMMHHSSASGPTSEATTPKSPVGPYIAISMPSPLHSERISNSSSVVTSTTTAAGIPVGTTTTTAGSHFHHHHHHQPSSTAPVSVPSSYQSDTMLANSAPTTLPRTYASLRDVSDWSCPGSIQETPSALSTALVDHWEVGLAMEGTLEGLDLQPVAQAGNSGGGGDLEDIDSFGSMILDEENQLQQQGSGRGWPTTPAVDVVPVRPGLTIHTSTSTSRADLTQINGGGGGGDGGEGGKGLQFAQQVAQLFVDRRKKSLDLRHEQIAPSPTASDDVSGSSNNGGGGGVGAASSPSKKPWSLVGKFRSGGGVPSKEATPAASPTKTTRENTTR